MKLNYELHISINWQISNLFTLAFINSFNMYPVFSTSLFLLILGTTSFPGTLNFIGELFNMISLSIVDVVFNGLFVTSIPLTTSYSLFLFKRSCGNIYLNYRNQTMDVSRLYLWIPSAALFPLTATKKADMMVIKYLVINSSIQVEYQVGRRLGL